MFKVNELREIFSDLSEKGAKEIIEKAKELKESEKDGDDIVDLFSTGDFYYWLEKFEENKICLFREYDCPEKQCFVFSDDLKELELDE